MPASEVVDAIPLAKDSRVTLDLVVLAFNRGATAEEIVQEFSGLQLPDVYQVIGYYLKHSAELAAYFEKRGREEIVRARDVPQLSGVEDAVVLDWATRYSCGIRCQPEWRPRKSSCWKTGKLSWLRGSALRLLDLLHERRHHLE